MELTFHRGRDRAACIQMQYFNNLKVMTAVLFLPLIKIFVLLLIK